MIVKTHSDVQIDECHISLIAALVGAAKPKTILEIGVGTGATTMALVRAANANANEAKVLLVDGFNDWHFKKPEGFDEIRPFVAFEQAQEKDFVQDAARQGRKFDFIVSDADHAHTGEWANETVSLVADGGILIFHDAAPHCPSVMQAVGVAQASGMVSMFFSKKSHPHERCERTLCVLQKP